MLRDQQQVGLAAHLRRDNKPVHLVYIEYNVNVRGTTRHAVGAATHDLLDLAICSECSLNMGAVS